jgi:MFS family permease
MSPWVVCSVYVMLLLGTMPDAMFPPVLNVLLLERYDVGVSSAFWFMSVNMAGVLAVLPFLPMLRRSMSPAVLIATGAALNGLCYWLMSLPLGLGWTLAVRAIEGAPDMVVLAGVLALIARSSGVEQRGFRFGLAGTVMLLGLAAGIISGGIFGERFPSGVFVVGAIECAVLAVIAVCLRTVLPAQGVQVGQAEDRARLRRRYPVWPAMLMLFADRGIAGALTVGGAVFLTYQLGLSTSTAGMLPAIPLLLMAVFNGPAGWLADRIGLVRVRVLACVVYGSSFVALAVGDDFGVWWLYAMFAVMGLAGAGLIPTSFALGSRAGGGTADMGLLQTAGQLGYFAAIVISGLVLTGIPGEAGLKDVVDERVVWSLLFAGFGTLYLLLNAVAVTALLWRRIRGAAAIGSGST